MRSTMIFAVLIAAVGFTGCCGTGGNRGLLGKRAARAAAEGTVIDAGDCGCGGDTVMSVSEPYDCGCGDAMYAGAPVVAPMEFSAEAPAGGCSGGECSACNGQAPGQARGLLAGRGAGVGTGMGLTKNGRGLACNTGLVGPAAREARQAARSLKPKRTKSTLARKFGFAKTEDTIISTEEYDLVSDEYIVGCDECAEGLGGRRISHGVISDFREARGRVSGSHAGCGRGGCGHSGKLCGACNMIRSLSGLGSGNPYGGAIPHTAQQPGQSGIAPSYAYPYYTTRGPRDFLRDNPPSIGR